MSTQPDTSNATDPVPFIPYDFREHDDPNRILSRVYRHFITDGAPRCTGPWGECANRSVLERDGRKFEAACAFAIFLPNALAKVIPEGRVVDAILPDLAGIITNPSTDPDLRDLTYRFVQWMALHLSLLSLLQRAHDTATASVDDFHREFRYGLQLISKALNLDYGLSLDD